MAKEGANVFLMDLDGKKLEASAEEIKKVSKGGDVAFCVADVSKPEACENAIREAEKKFKHINYLFNNAGY